MDAEKIKQNRIKALAALRNADENFLRCNHVLINNGRYCAFGYMGHALGLRFHNSENAYKRISAALGVNTHDRLEILNLHDRYKYSWITIASILSDLWEINVIDRIW